MKEDDISITINGQTHRFTSGDVEAMQNMPWPQRKKLIDLLETIREAEYVASASPEATEKPTVSKTNTADQSAVDSPAITPTVVTNPAQQQTAQPAKDDVVRSQNPDDLMQQLIMQEKQHSRSIPDRMTVVKYMLAVIVVIILVSMLF